MARVNRLACLALAGTLLAHAAGAGPLEAADAPARRAAGLPSAWRDPQAARTVFFVGGMSCRACTMLLDRKLAEMEGVYWARFNFPLRLLIVYHDQRTVSTAALRDLVSQGELRAEMTESYPASGYHPERRVRVASWRGGGVALEEARGIPARFEASLKAQGIDPGDAEHDQIAGEIIGEEVRRRILSERATAAGYASGPVETVLPPVLAREFYYPAEALRPTPGEAGIALFLKEKVMLGDDGEQGRARFDSWLRSLWKEVRLDFRPEYLEFSP